MLASFALAAAAYGCAHNSTPPVARDGATDREEYLRLVVRELSSNYSAPQGVAERGTSLLVTVILYIEADGRIARWVFESRSADPEFDKAIAALVQRVHLPPPPEALRESVRTSGLGVHFRP
jgi:hypothetical protein